MIGFYDYTVVLTYMSLLSAIGGIALVTSGHPILATYCLLFSGLCDMFDGKVARTKKNRTAEEKSFGIQIDSLTDIVAFGVLPATMTITLCGHVWYSYIVAALFSLTGMIRLAYFNVTEEMRQKETDECRKTYTGLPITSSSLIFPFFFCIISVFCLCYDGRIELFLELFNKDSLRIALCILMSITGFAFVLPFRIRKPQSREFWWFLGFGALMAIVLFIVYLRFTAI
ncbi:MAG: CDP-diacylglycerol--serine O-phosphatidyltransferase [Ruminococcaceae bacterium]|nr:CDP-diacylglycerol--serine O-phosphatidyltransferase [Oscillospiraceae bacterium]